MKFGRCIVTATVTYAAIVNILAWNFYSHLNYKMCKFEETDDFMEAVIKLRPDELNNTLISKIKQLIADRNNVEVTISHFTNWNNFWLYKYA